MLVPVLLSGGRVVALTGVRDLCAVETADAILVANRNDAQSVKQVVESLRNQGKRCGNDHVVGFRPWGTYETLVMGGRFWGQTNCSKARAFIVTTDVPPPRRALGC